MNLIRNGEGGIMRNPFWTLMTVDDTQDLKESKISYRIFKFNLLAKKIIQLIVPTRQFFQIMNFFDIQ